MERSARARLLALVFVAVATFAAFWPLLGHDFDEYDDTQYVTRNGHVQEGFTPASLRWAWTSTYASNWHPVTWMSHMLDWRLYGASAGGHHAVSLLLHALNACLLFLIFERTTGAPGRSAWVAALFAVHPLHVESVAWIAERKDVLSTLFWMLATLAYVRYARAPRERSPWPVAALMVLGLLSKPMLVTLPFALVLMDFWPLGRWERERSRGAVLGVPLSLLREKTPLFALSAASCVVTLLAQRGAIGSLEHFTAAARVGNAILSYVAYLGKTAWPSGLAVFYPFPREASSAASVAGAALFLAAVTFLAFRLRRSRPYVLAGWLGYLGTLVPVIGLVQVGSQAMADRYTYVPLIGIFVIAAWGGADLLGAPRRSRGGASAALTPATGDPAWMLVPAAALLLSLGVATRAQLHHWRDAESLFRRAVSVVDSGVARTNLGEALLNRGRATEAAREFEVAVRIDPSSYQAQNSLGLILEQDSRPEEARRRYEEALKIRPDYRTVHRNLGRLLLSMGRVEEAIEHDRRAVELDPGDAEAHGNLGIALAGQGRPAEAVAHYEAALAVAPGSAEVHNNLGSALARLGRVDEAVGHYAEAVRLRPGYGTAHYNLATAFYLKSRFEEAWREVRAARDRGYAPPQRFLDLLSAKMPEPRAGSANDAGGRRGE